jgi:hypothetical protein
MARDIGNEQGSGPATVPIAPGIAAESLESLVKERERIMREYRKIGEAAIKVANQLKKVDAKIRKAKEKGTRSAR